MTSVLRLAPRAVLALCVLLLGSAAAPGAAPALPLSGPVTFNVNSVNDAVADFTGDPNFDICRTSPSNTTCTLRAAIMNANRHAGSATINLPAGTYQLSILPIGLFNDAGGSLDISRTVTLAGQGAAGTIVDGGGLDRVFLIASAAVLTMTGLRVQHGRSGAGGGIYNFFGQLSLANTVLSGNYANGDGGGLINFGTATISQTTVESNTAANDGGGVNNFGTLTIDTSTIADNTANDGGAVTNNGGNLTLFDSTLSNNSVSLAGGGIYNLNAGTARIFDTTIAGNLADNQALHGGSLGGGIFNLASTNAVQIWNSVLAYNFASHFDSQCAGFLYSQDYNYIALSGSCPLTGTTTHNLVENGDPLLGELADNGGPTWTRALGAGSVVVDQIPPALCRDQFGSAPVPDQRGVPRPVGPLCDMGAYEGTVATPIYLHNLIRNGDAEASAGSPNGAFVGVPAWLNGSFFGPPQPTQLTVVTYNAAGGFPSVPTDTVPVNHGANFFAGGYVTTSIGSQRVAFNGITSAIDAGSVRYVFSADLGGFDSQDDKAVVTMQFANQIGSFISTVVTLDGPNASGRANHTGFLHVTQTGPVPPKAAGAYITLTLTRASGSGRNNGYADNISLVLLPPTLFLPLVVR